MCVRIFCRFWPFSRTYTVSGRSRKLIANLAPRVGANENGADVVQVGARDRTRRSSPLGPAKILRGRVGASGNGAELPGLTEPRSSSSAPSSMAPTF